MRASGLTMHDLAEAIGVSQSTISRMLNGQMAISRDLHEYARKHLPDAATYPAEAWSHEVRKVTRDIPTRDDIKIPLYWQTVPAGTASPIVSDSADEFNVTQRYRDTFAVYIRGDSLIGVGIEDGDIAVFREGQIPVDGAVVFACIDGMCTAKVYRQMHDGVWLVPANDRYDPIEVGGRSLSVRGVLINIIREPKRYLTQFKRPQSKGSVK